MAANPSGGSGAMGMIAGVGMGNVVGGAMQGAAQPQQPTPPAAGPPPLPDQVQWYAGIDNQHRSGDPRLEAGHGRLGEGR